MNDIPANESPRCQSAFAGAMAGTKAALDHARRGGMHDTIMGAVIIALALADKLCAGVEDESEIRATQVGCASAVEDFCRTHNIGPT